jgi:hypothetical protein
LEERPWRGRMSGASCDNDGFVFKISNIPVIRFLTQFVEHLVIMIDVLLCE